MERDIVIIPTFDRPEYLAACLEYLGRAEGSRSKHIWVVHDSHRSDEERVAASIDASRSIATKSSASFETVRFSLRAAHGYWGNPCNILEAYKEAYLESSVRFIYLVEDDVLVGHDFFRWHEAIHFRKDLFCTVGWDCRRNRKACVTADPTTYIETSSEYASIGVCWRRESLATIVRHACAEYYSDCEKYLRTTFPDCPIPANKWIEQAGLILRVLHEAKTHAVAWPTLRRCAHVGVYGYHRPGGQRFQGSLEERLCSLRLAVTQGNIVEMGREYVGEVDLVLDPAEWEEHALRLVQVLPYSRSYQNDAT